MHEPLPRGIKDKLLDYKGCLVLKSKKKKKSTGKKKSFKEMFHLWMDGGLIVKPLVFASLTTSF